MPSLTLSQLAESLGAEMHGPAELEIHGVCPLEEPKSGFLGFAENARQLRTLRGNQGRLTAVIVAPGTTPDFPHLVHAKPRVAFAKALSLFHPTQPVRPGVHATACISPTAEVSPLCEIGPFCVVGPGSRIEAGTRLIARVMVGSEVHVSADCEVFPGAVLGDGVQVGARSILDAHCRLAAETSVGEDVYVGVRSVLQGCHLGGGSKMDNMSLIGADSQIGPHSLLVSKSHVGCGVKTGPYFLIAAVSCVDDGVELGPVTQVAGFSRVDRSWPAPKLQLAGEPAGEMKQETNKRALRRRALKIYQDLVARRRG